MSLPCIYHQPNGVDDLIIIPSRSYNMHPPLSTRIFVPTTIHPQLCTHLYPPAALHPQLTRAGLVGFSTPSEELSIKGQTLDKLLDAKKVF
jgi:hypothetical protein